MNNRQWGGVQCVRGVGWQARRGASGNSVGKKCRVVGTGVGKVCARGKAMRVANAGVVRVCAVAGVRRAWQTVAERGK